MRNEQQFDFVLFDVPTEFSKIFGAATSV